MSAEVQTAVPDAPDETEPTQVESEQTEIASTGLEAELLKLAAEQGLIGKDPPLEEVEAISAEPEVLESEVPATETEVETKEEDAEGVAEGVDAKAEEVKPEAKSDDVWPDSAKERVAEETAKRKRWHERAEKAESEAEQLRAQLASAVGPKPTEANPFIDVQDVNALDSLEASYEKTLELADENPDALVEQICELEKKNSGVDLIERMTPEQILSLAKRKAEKAIRRQIPERRNYLAQRQVADAEAAKVYPELANPDSEFTQTAAYLAQRILSGEAVKDPTLLTWIGHAVKGYQMSLQKNGDTKPVSTDNGKKILAASKQKIAPPPTKTRALSERGGVRGSDLAKAEKELESKRTHEAGEKYLAALFANSRAGAGKVERVA